MAQKKNASQLTFDIGAAEEVATCASCHPGGGPYEFDRTGKRLDSVNSDDVSALDGDYYTYSSDETKSGAVAKPHKFDWRKSGSLEADCFTCHLDPDAKRITDANGIKPVAYNPRVRIFAKREKGKAVAVSLGIYPGAGWQSAFTYSDPLSRSKTKFEAGKFYSDLDNPMADSRNYLRQPYVEGEGTPFTDLQAKRKFLGNFFAQAPSGGLMGWDNNQDGYPVTYIKIEKNKDEFRADVYYEAEEFDKDDEISIPMLSSKDTENGENKWTRVCAQCHAGVQDPINKSFQVRTWGLGMKADIVKRAEIWNLNPQTEKDPGYDVHAVAGLECTSCHAKGKPDSVKWDDYVTDADHNFAKGNDPGNHVRDDLDNAPSPKNCYYCHVQEGNGPDPAEAHEEVFGSAAKTHVAKIACETCHIPEVRYWTFRSFDYSLGFTYNYDNRHFPGPNGKMMQVLLPPYYGPIPDYGMGNVSWLVGHKKTDDYATDVLAPVAYMDPNKSNDMFGQMYQHMTGQKGFEWSPPMIYSETTRGKQIVIANPIMVQTWFDKTLKKVLYPREINAAVKGHFFTRKGQRYSLLITGAKIYDKTGFMGHPDMKPEISTLDDIQKMRKALIKILHKEGERNPNPVLYIAAHYFKISHGVLPADQALGANGTCASCHGKNGRVEDRLLTFSPNSIQGFNQGVKAGLIFVDPEVKYIKPVDLDGDGKADVLGATQKEVLKITEEELNERNNK